MVDLMLDDTSSKISETKCIFLSFRIEKCYFDPIPTFDFAFFSRNRETSFYIFSFFFRVFENDRIDHSNSTKYLIIVGLHKRDDDKALVHSYLRSSKSYAAIIRIFDMLYHIVCKRSIFFDFLSSYRI